MRLISFFKILHLNKNGILIFDFWYEDGVFSLQSPLQLREINNSNYKIVKFTISKCIKNKTDFFDIHNLIVLNKKNKKFPNFKKYKMRYFNMKIKKKLHKHKFYFLESLDLQTGKSVIKTE